MQQGCIRDDISETDIDNARRTNRFDSSNVVVVACACTKRHQMRPDAASVHYINIIIHPGRTAACEADESFDQEDKTSSSNDQQNKIETADYLKDSSCEFSMVLRDTNLGAGEEDLSKLSTSTPLRTQKIKTSQETDQVAKTMQDKSVTTKFMQNILLEARSKKLDLVKDNYVETQRCFCSEPRIIPHRTKKIIALNSMRIPACLRSNNVCRKINKRDIVRCWKMNDVEVEDFRDVSEYRDENHYFTMYNNSSDYEVCRADEERNDRIVQTISRNYIEDKLNRWRNPTERNLNAQDVRKEWMYVEYLIDDTLKLLRGTNASIEKRLKIKKKHRKNYNIAGAIHNGITYETRIPTDLD